MGKKDPRVDTYIEQSAAFAQPVLRYIRKTVHAASPAIDETIKWGFPHFMYNGILCSMASFKEHCAFGFWKGELVVRGTGKAGETAMGQFGRIKTTSDLPARTELIGYVRDAMRLNDAGVKTPKAAPAQREQRDHLPDALRRALDEHPAAQAHFLLFSPSQRREYIDWIADAKRDETRDRRVATAIEWISDGKPRNWKYIKR
jgi:uncharacterized protein YdeI (YjbR/CyaY-like superfamily)